MHTHDCVCVCVCVCVCLLLMKNVIIAEDGEVSRGQLITAVFKKYSILNL